MIKLCLKVAKLNQTTESYGKIKKRPMEHQFLHLIIAPLVWQPKCELNPNEHSMYIRFLISPAIDGTSIWLEYTQLPWSHTLEGSGLG
jgi:hypothetical protein